MGQKSMLALGMAWDGSIKRQPFNLTFNCQNVLNLLIKMPKEKIKSPFLFIVVIPSFLFKRFNLTSIAIYGSLERFLAILIEHYQGNWPFFLNPRQVVILPITTTTSSDQSKEEMVDYAKWVENDLKTRVLYGSGQILHVDVEQRFHLSLSKRLKEVRKLPYAVFLVVGDKERQRGTISVRSKSDDQQESDLEALAAEFIQWMKSYY